MLKDTVEMSEVLSEQKQMGLDLRRVSCCAKANSLQQGSSAAACEAQEGARPRGRGAAAGCLRGLWDFPEAVLNR